MRVGRVSSIKFMPYRDVKMLLRYFSLKGVKLQAKNTDFSKINKLQPSNSKDAKQKVESLKSLNNITLDAFEKQQMDIIKRMDLPLKDKAEIDLIKLMMKAREGSKINTMKYMVDNKLFDSNEKRDNEKRLEDKKESGSEKQENIKKYEHKDTKTLVQEYAEFLKEIDKKSQKEESKKESEKEEKQSEEF